MNKILELNLKKNISFFSFEDIKNVNTYISNKKEKSKIEVYENMDDFYKIEKTNNCFYNLNKRYDIIISETKSKIECFIISKCLNSSILSKVCNKIVKNTL